ncbi:hypothetical protein [Streptosporangium sp. NPDC023615]|uniref:hypothetical protein n=1 Tax=Streptosporangium sp. NPDC023615 TaxID=3154794 RepID=UPI00341F259E
MQQQVQVRGDELAELVPITQEGVVARIDDHRFAARDGNDPSVFASGRSRELGLSVKIQEEASAARAVAIFITSRRGLSLTGRNP